MTRQIRLLGLGLMVCFCVLFVQLNRLTVFQAARAQRQPGQHPRHPARLQPAARQRHHRRRRGDRPVRPVRTTGSSTSASTPRARCSPTSPATSASPSAAPGVEKTYNDELAGRTLDLSFQDLSDLFVDKDRVGNLTLTVRADLQQIASDQLGERRGLGRGARPAHRRDPRPRLVPHLRPQPAGQPRHRPPPTVADRCSTPTPDKPRLARTYQDRFFPGSTFKVVTATAGILYGGVTADEPVYPAEQRLHTRRAPRDRSGTSAARPAAARCSRSCGCPATPPSPRWASTPAPTR